MATEKQIAANRANALRSSGPKTPAGRARSGRNAFRHGLSLPMEMDADVSAKIVALVAAFAATIQITTGSLPSRRSRRRNWSYCGSARYALTCWPVPTWRKATQRSCNACWHWIATSAWPTPGGEERSASYSGSVVARFSRIRNLASRDQTLQRLSRYRGSLTNLTTRIGCDLMRHRDR
jgi:hypothetical protein